MMKMARTVLGFIPNLRARPEQTPAMTRLSGRTRDLVMSQESQSAPAISAPRRPIQG